MKLSKFSIRNFKGIKELSINIENISIIIGPNNSSKSTILQALKQFGSNDLKLDESCYHNHDTSEPIYFCATFTNVTEEEANLHGIRASLHEETGNFIVRAKYTYGESVERASKISGSDTHDLEREGWDGKLGGGKNGSHFLNAFPEIIYIPAVKNASEELKNTSSHMKTLATLYKDVIHNLDEYKEAQTKTKLLQDKINQHEDEKIKFFESEVQTFLKDVTSTRITFNVDVKPLDEIVSTSVLPYFNFNGLDTDLSNQGNGVQRTFILSIFKGYRKYKKMYATEEKEKTMSNRPLIIALEEPELYLHPQLARVFKDTLYSLADEDFFQVIATSHSPNFIDLSKPNRTLAKLSLDSTKKVNISQVNSDIYGLPEEEKERFQALLRFNPHINEVFFADNVILVEGDTEVVALKLIGEKLVEAGHLEPDAFYRTSVINCGGKGTMYILLNVLNNFGVKYTVIHDFDITEFNSKGERRSMASLKSVLTLNHKIEALTTVRGNKKYVFQNTFETEMPADYEKGSSKSYTAFEYLRTKSLDELPHNFLNIIKSAFGLNVIPPLDHSNANLLKSYVWTELQMVLLEWTEPFDNYVLRLWNVPNAVEETIAKV